MNAQIRHVGLGAVVLMVVLAAQLTWLQVIDAEHLADDPRNTRTFLRDFTGPRGEILSADGKVVARSVPVDDEYERQRLYPLGELFAQTVGYQSIWVGSTGVEKAYNDVLSGRDLKSLKLKDLGELLLGKERSANVVLSLRSDAQQLAKDALGGQKGSVVVLEPATGAIVAMYSTPSFDPQPLASHKHREVQAYFNLLAAAPDNPALPRTYRERYPPGSTFKIVTTEAALDTGIATPEREFPSERSFTPPQASQSISNFGGRSCGGNLEEVFVNSCNTAFARLGFELGEQFPLRMQGFGVYAAPPIDLDPGAVASTGPLPGTFATNKPSFALAGIGQGEVATTPLQMAMVAGAVATGGTVMRPHVGAEVTDDEGRTLRTIPARAWKTAMPAATAATIRDYMVQVVERGTGTAAQIDGVAVAGKTGTAQTCEGCKPHAWFVAFAPAEAPRYAVAVIVENGGVSGDTATGGRVAAPIATRMLRLLLGV
ncbi:MAG: penicillin-binding protein 2 [Actinobacteria bacterium]|nr:penicillin-binding protein 2 [Actinomycetota bacterium]